MHLGCLLQMISHQLKNSVLRNMAVQQDMKHLKEMSDLVTTTIKTASLSSTATSTRLPSHVHHHHHLEPQTKGVKTYKW
jgi:hypothetical protein